MTERLRKILMGGNIKPLSADEAAVKTAIDNAGSGGGGGGSSDAFIVTLKETETENVYTSDKTVDEAIAAYATQPVYIRMPVGRDGDANVPVYIANDGYVMAALIIQEGSGHMAITIIGTNDKGAETWTAVQHKVNYDTGPLYVDIAENEGAAEPPVLSVNLSEVVAAYKAGKQVIARTFDYLYYLTQCFEPSDGSGNTVVQFDAVYMYGENPRLVEFVFTNTRAGEKTVKTITTS